MIDADGSLLGVTRMIHITEYEHFHEQGYYDPGDTGPAVFDTHVGRISKKLGLTDQKDPVKAERQLNECVPREDWKDFGHLLIDHGRKTCRARAPKCDECGIYKWCEVRA